MDSRDSNEAIDGHAVAVSAEWTQDTKRKLGFACARLIEKSKHASNKVNGKALTVQSADAVSMLKIEKRIRHALTSHNAIKQITVLIESRQRKQPASKAEVKHYVFFDVPSRVDAEVILRLMRRVRAVPLWRRKTSFGETVKFRISLRSLRLLLPLIGARKDLSGIRTRLSVAVFSYGHRAIHVPWQDEYGSSMFRGSLTMSIYRVA